MIQKTIHRVIQKMKHRMMRKNGAQKYTSLLTFSQQLAYNNISCHLNLYLIRATLQCICLYAFCIK